MCTISHVRFFFEWWLYFALHDSRAPIAMQRGKYANIYQRRQAVCVLMACKWKCASAYFGDAFTGCGGGVGVYCGNKKKANLLLPQQVFPASQSAESSRARAQRAPRRFLKYMGDCAVWCLSIWASRRFYFYDSRHNCIYHGRERVMFLMRKLWWNFAIIYIALWFSMI